MFNQFEVNDMTIGMDYLPEDIARIVNKNLAFGGGGGGAQTTTTSLDPDIKRAILPALQDVTRDYRSGTYEQRAGQEGVQEALTQQEGLAQKTMSEGLGTENLLNQLRSTEGQIIQGQQGALGSARADRAREAAMTDQAMQLQQADLNAKQQSAEAIGQIANQRRGLEQETLDAPISGAERYFGLLGSAPQSQSQTTTGGGGK